MFGEFTGSVGEIESVAENVVCGVVQIGVRIFRGAPLFAFGGFEGEVSLRDASD